MSAVGRQLAKEAYKDLYEGEQKIRRASDALKEAGDGPGAKEVEKVANDAGTIRESIRRKLGHEAG